MPAIGASRKQAEPVWYSDPSETHKINLLDTHKGVGTSLLKSSKVNSKNLIRDTIDIHVPGVKINRLETRVTLRYAVSLSLWLELEGC